MAATLAYLRKALPEGGGLTDEVFARRHRAMLALLWGHAAFIPIYAVVQDYSLLHTIGESLVLPAAATAASLPFLSRRIRTLAAAVGLLSASAVLVHLSGGLIEMHFHFFVMVAAVAMYQDWIPFLMAIFYVLVHHGLIGTIDPSSVYNHPPAVANPWKWAGVHALFIAGISAAMLTYWRLNETYLAERTSAEERARREARTVARLNEISRDLTGDFEIEHLITKIVDASAELTGADYAVYVPTAADDDGRPAFALSTARANGDTSFFREPLEPDQGPVGADFERPLRIGDASAGEAPAFTRFLPSTKGAPPRSVLAVPVISRGRVVGGLIVAHHDPDRFDVEDERLVAGIATHAAAALDAAALFEGERRATQRIAILSEASRALLRSFDVDSLLQELASLVVPELTDAFSADLREQDGTVRRVVLLTDPRYIGDVQEHDFDPPDLSNPANPMTQAMIEGRTTHFPELPDEILDEMVADEERRERARALAPTSAIIVPLVARERIVGAFTLASVRASGRRLNEGDVELAEELARRAAIAVENATLYARQRTAAETLQHALLPEDLPNIPGVSAAARYVAGGPDVDIGGDWYDAVLLRDGSVAIAMGDVVGRGISAASLMGQLKSALRAYALEGCKPAEVLRKLNEMLLEVGPGDQMATLVYGIFDPSTGLLRLSNAGHPPPVVVLPNGASRIVAGPPGMPLGALARARYEEIAEALLPGSSLVLYTDGLVETRDTSLDDGIERLRDAAATTEGMELEDLCDVLLESALAGRHGADDTALLAIRWHELGEHLQLHLPARPTIIKPLRATLRRWLRDAGATERESFEILTATGEAVANVIRHAATSAAPDFELEANRNGRIELVVRDFGQWRPQGHLRSPGHGLDIMHEFMDTVELDRGLAGTSVRMRRSLGAAGGEA